MTSGQKTALSLLISIVLFAAFVVAAFTGLFSVIDARFYEPEKISQVQKHLDTIAQNYDEYIETLELRFGKGENSFLKQECSKYFLEDSPSGDYVTQRRFLQGDLFDQTPGLLGMRLIDKDGIRIHFSTFSFDKLDHPDNLLYYKNYTDVRTENNGEEIKYERISSSDSYGSSGTVCKTLFDGKNNRIVFSFPYYDSVNAYRGTFVFYVNANDFNGFLRTKKIISFGESGTVISNLYLDDKKDVEIKSGFVFGIPSVGKSIFENEILNRWEKGITAPEKIVYSEGSKDTEKSDERSLIKKIEKDKYWVLVSSTKTAFGYIGGIYPDEMLAMPDSVKILLLICIFVTLFLIVFLIVNAKQDDMVLIRSRIKKLQIGIVNDYLKQKENVDWKVVSGKIADRRQDVTSEILRSLGRKGKRHEKEVNELINKSWDELLAAMNVQQRKEESQSGIVNAAEIKSMLEQILSSGAIKVQNVNTSVTPVAVTEKVETVSKPEPVEDLEEVEELDEAEPVEDLEEVEELDEAEPVEDVEVTSFDSENSETEEININEFSDTFAKHDPSAEIESSADVEELNRKAADVARNYDKEDDDIIENFSVANPDFSDLDNLDDNDDEKAVVNMSENISSADSEEISLDEFGISEKPEVEYDFSEEIGFGSVENNKSSQSVESIKFDIEPESLDFKSLDKKVEVKLKRGNKNKVDVNDSIYGVSNIEKEVQAETKDDDVCELQSADLDVPFTFTQFGSNTTNPEELKPYVNVIHEDETGMVEIKSEGQEIEPTNLDFKNLVDSVIKR